MSQRLTVQRELSAPKADQPLSGMLQRKCGGCGNHTVAGDKCQECNKKKPFALQAKLTMGETGDAYEQEADRIADQILGAPANSFLSGAPPRIRRFVGQATGRADAVPTSVDPVLAGSGSPLDATLRQDMEQRLGHDFSKVRVHSGVRAEQSARDVNAYAYTAGHNIVFGAGRFAPATQEGRRLIAHELVHVVQQSGGTRVGESNEERGLSAVTASRIQRLSPGDPSFQISGLPSYSGARLQFVYFDRKDSQIPSIEDHKIADFAAANHDQPVINLYGYASEEGLSLENDVLIAERLSNVRTVLLQELNRTTPYSGTINLIPRRNASSGQIDYRMFRSVEIAIGASSIGASTASVHTRNCETDEDNKVNIARDAALLKVGEAVRQVRSFQTSPTTNTDVSNALDNNFHSHSAATITTLLNNLSQVVTDMGALNGSSRRQCASEQYNLCNNADALTTRPVVTFCPNFFDSDTPDQREETLTHEMAHYALFHADDRGYRFERVLPFLSTVEALDNAESIAIFIVEINDPARARVESRLTVPADDTVAGCGGNQTLVKEALAWAERWNTYAFFGVSQTYSNWDNFRFMAPYITWRLGPVNLHSLAGIFDRYSSLMGWFNGQFDFECPSPASGTCTSPAQLDAVTDVLIVCPSFFSQNLHGRIISLYAEVTKKVPEIRDDQRTGYAELARDYKIHFWGLPPS